MRQSFSIRPTAALGLLLLGVGLFGAAGCPGDASARRAERRLSEDLRSGDQGRRMVAVRALGERIGLDCGRGAARALAPETVAALSEALRDPRYRLRAQAALDLAAAPGAPDAPDAPEEMLAVLSEALREPGIALLRREAAQICSDHDPRAEATYALFLQNLKARFPAAPPIGARGSADAFSTATLAVLQARTRALQNEKDPRIRAAAALELGRMGRATGPVLGALTKALRDPDPAVCRAVVWALGRLGPAAFAARAEVERLIRAPRTDLAAAAVQALMRIDPQSRFTVLELTALLDHPDPAMRSAVAVALMAYGTGARPIHEDVALERLKDVVWAQNLALRVMEPVFPVLLRRLGDPDPRVRAAAAAAMGRTTPYDDKAAAALALASGDPSPLVQSAALWALGDLGANSPQVRQALAKACASPNEAVRMAAAEALGRAAPAEPATAALLGQALGDGSPNVRAAAAEAFARLSPALASDPAALAELKALRKDPDPAVRGAAAAALGHANLNTEETVRLLAEALADPQPLVRGRAAQALGGLGSEAKAAVPALLALARPGNANEWDAALALAWIGEPAALDVLTRRMADPAFWQQEIGEAGDGGAGPDGDLWPQDPVELVQRLTRAERSDPRAEAILALGWLGAKAAPALPLLTGYLKNRNNPIELRLLTAMALAAIAPELKNPLYPTVIAALRDEQATLREAAALALQGLGPRAAPAVPELLRVALERKNAYALRCAAIAAVGTAGTDTSGNGRAGAALAGLLKDGDGRVRGAAALALGELDAEGTTPALIAALGDREAEVRQAAAGALGRTAPASGAAVAALGEALKDGDFRVQLAAAGALGRIGPEARAALPALSVASRDPNPLVHEAAQGAMAEMSEPHSGMASPGK